MARSLCALFMYAFVLTLTGCGAGVEEQAPPTEAPVMTEEEKANMEKQMQMSKPQGQ